MNDRTCTCPGEKITDEEELDSPRKSQATSPVFHDGNKTQHKPFEVRRQNGSRGGKEISLLGSSCDRLGAGALVVIGPASTMFFPMRALSVKPSIDKGMGESSASQIPMSAMSRTTRARLGGAASHKLWIRKKQPSMKAKSGS